MDVTTRTCECMCRHTHIVNYRHNPAGFMRVHACQAPTADLGHAYRVCLMEMRQEVCPESFSAVTHEGVDTN